MKLLFILGIAIAIGVVTFAFQYSAPASVILLLWRYEYPAAVALYVTLCLGALVAWLVSIPSVIKGQRIGARLRRQVASLEDDRTVLELRVSELELEIAQGINRRSQ